MISDQQETIYALSPDNELAIRRLIQLFQTCYDDHYPIKGVYDIDFWKHRIGSRFTSVVITNNSQMIAHVAFSPDPMRKNQVQILHVAYHPEYLETLDSNAALLCEQMEQLAQRQEWENCYCYMPCLDVESPPSQIEHLLDFGLQLRKSAVIPDYFSGLEEDDKESLKMSSSCSVYIRVFSKHGQTNRSLFPPKHLQGYVQRTSKHLAVQRSFEEHADHPHALPTDLPAISSRRFHLMDITHVYIQPSLVSNIEDALRELASIQAQGRTLIFINIEDPGAAKLTKVLLDTGYIVGGYFPLFCGNDNLMLISQNGEHAIDSLFHLLKSESMNLLEEAINN